MYCAKTLFVQANATASSPNAGENLPVTVGSALGLNGADKDNYTLAPVSDLTVNISRAELKVGGFTAEDKPYDGTADVTYDGEPVIYSDGALTVEGELEISFEDAEAGTDKALLVSGITLKDGNNNDITKNYNITTDVTASIRPKPVTVTVTGGLEKYYGEYDPGFTYEVTGLVGTDSPDILGIVLTRQSGEDAGSYPISIKTQESGNYSVNFTPASFVIKPAPLVKVSVATKDFVYDGASHDGFLYAEQPSLDVTYKPGRDISVEGNVASALGSHVITVTGIGNYSGKLTTTWMITMPEIAGDVMDGTITGDNVLTDLSEERLEALLLLADALDSIDTNPDATDEEKQEAADAAAALKPIMEALEKEANDIVGEIEKWLDDLPAATVLPVFVI